MRNSCHTFCPLVAPRPNAVHGLLIKEVSRSNTTTHHIRYDSPGRVISLTQRTLPDNTRQTDMHVPGEIRTHNLSRRAAADPRLRPRGHWYGLLTRIRLIHLTLQAVMKTNKRKGV